MFSDRTNNPLINPTVRTGFVDIHTTRNNDSTPVSTPKTGQSTSLFANKQSLDSREVSKSTNSPLITDQNNQQKFIKLFLNGESLKTLSFDELVELSKIYTFSTDDLIEINNINFTSYFFDNERIKFVNIPEELQTDIAIFKYNLEQFEFIRYIPVEYQTQEMVDRFFNAFCQSDNNYLLLNLTSYIKFFSVKFQTREMWDKLLLKLQQVTRHYKPGILDAVPKEFQTIELCKPFACDTEYFKLFSEDVKTLEICTLYINNAVKLNLNLIPKKIIIQLQQQIVARIKNETDRVSIEGVELLSVDLLKQLLNLDIVIDRCIDDKSLLHRLPAEVLTEKILTSFARKNLSYIPEQCINIGIILSRITTCRYLTSDEIEIINYNFDRYKEQIQKAVLSLSHIDTNNCLRLSVIQLYRFIPDHLTEDKCLNLIKLYKGDVYRHLPNNYKENIHIISYMLNNYIYKINGSDVKHFTAETYKKFLDLFPATPKWEISVDYHIDFIVHKNHLISAIPEKNRSLEIWLYICNSNRRHIHKIPEQLFTKEALMFLVDESVKKNNIIDITFMEYLFEHKFFDNTIKQKLLWHSLQCSARSSNVFLSIIKSSKIPYSFKIELEKKMRAGELGFTKPSDKELAAKTNPLQQTVEAPYAELLLSKIYEVVFSSLKDRSLPLVTQRLQDFLEQPIKEFPTDTTKNIFNNPVLVGGRTMQVNTSDNKAIFYKFRKPREMLQDFAKEGRFLQFLDQTSNGQKLCGLLQSDIPKLEKMVRIPLTELPCCATECPDGLDIIEDSNGIQYVDMLVYSGSNSYYHYAHTPDIKNPQELYKKPIEGMSKAIHDVGILTGLGIYPTSMLPAFHFIDYHETRQWTMLHMLMRDISIDDTVTGELSYPRRNELYMTGKFSSWLNAIDMPDIGLTGFRDFGDIEFHGQILEPLKRFGSKKSKLFSTVKQMVAATNTVSECLTAPILLYARLHLDDPNYHYRNELCINETAEFIENILSTLLSARLKIANQPSASLQQFLHLSDTDYKNALIRSAKELVYWTSNTGNSTDNRINHIQQRKLPEDLYDHYSMLDNPSFRLKYNPEDLGRINGTFPLLSYTNLTFLLNTGLLENNA